jgi:hypothetical protein
LKENGVTRYGFVDKVTINSGPSYNDGSATVAGSQQSELDTVKTNLIKKLGRSEGPELDAAIDADGKIRSF